jgi:hypothetical protein
LTYLRSPSMAFDGKFRSIFNSTNFAYFYDQI